MTVFQVAVPGKKPFQVAVQGNKPTAKKNLGKKTRAKKTADQAAVFCLTDELVLTIQSGSSVINDLWSDEYQQFTLLV